SCGRGAGRAHGEKEQWSAPPRGPARHPAVRTRCTRSRPRRRQSRKPTRLPGDHDAESDAGRSHPMDQGRDLGRSDIGVPGPCLSIVVPVYNEGETIARTLRGLVEHITTQPLEILIVYDFDEDTTVPAVRRLQSDIPEVRLHRNHIRRGALNAIKSGF